MIQDILCVLAVSVALQGPASPASDRRVAEMEAEAEVVFYQGQNLLAGGELRDALQRFARAAEIYHDLTKIGTLGAGPAISSYSYLAETAEKLADQLREELFVHAPEARIGTLMRYRGRSLKACRDVYFMVIELRHCNANLRCESTVLDKLESAVAECEATVNSTKPLPSPKPPEGPTNRQFPRVSVSHRPLVAMAVITGVLGSAELISGAVLLRTATSRRGSLYDRLVATAPDKPVDSPQKAICDSEAPGPELASLCATRRERIVTGALLMTAGVVLFCSSVLLAVRAERIRRYYDETRPPGRRRPRLSIRQLGPWLSPHHVGVGLVVRM